MTDFGALLSRFAATHGGGGKRHGKHHHKPRNAKERRLAELKAEAATMRRRVGEARRAVAA